MSRKALELLQALDLLDANGAPADLDRMDDATLRSNLTRYYDARKSHAEDERYLKSDRQLSAVVSSISARGSPDAIVPAAIIYDRLFTSDRLFQQAAPTDQASAVHAESLGLPDPNALDRTAIQISLQQIAQLRPLIQQGAVAVVPMALLHPVPDAKPIVYSEDGFASLVPEKARQYIERHVRIQKAVPAPGVGMVIMPHRVETPVRGIVVGFTGDPAWVRQMSMYIYQDVEVEEAHDDGHLTLSMSAPFDKPPSKAAYDHWVRESINRTVLDRLERISVEAKFADKLGAVYLSESEFESRLCGAAVESSPVSAVNFLRATVPFMRTDSADVVAHVRERCAREMEEFRQSLFDISSDLSGSGEDFNRKARQFVRYQIEPQVRSLRNQLKRVASSALSGSFLGAGAVALMVTTGQAPPLISQLAYVGLGAAATSLVELREYLSKRPGPMMIWSKLGVK